MKKLLTKTDISVSKIYIEKKLTSRLPCQYYADFLKYNKHEIHLFIVNFENLDNLCSKFSIVSHYLAYKAYNLKDNKLAFKYAEMACKSIPSRSCEMAAFLALEDDYDTPSYELRMFNAQELLKIGHEQGDIKSASMLHDIYNRPKLFYKYANPDLAKKIFPTLEISQDISAKIQVRKLCFNGDPISRILKNCTLVCNWAKYISKSSLDLDVGSISAIKRIFKDVACRDNAPKINFIASPYTLNDTSPKIEKENPKVIRKEVEPKIVIKEPNKVEDINKLYRVGSGTGFAVSNDGHIITNNHVIKSCQKVKVHISGKKYVSQVLSRDKKNDLALLKINFKPKFVFPISNKPSELMQEVYVAGFPFGYRLSTRIKVTKGIVSSLAGLGDDFTRVQIDAAIQPGNSGGPIYDNFGNVIAVAVAKLDYKYSMKELNTIPELTNFGIKASMLYSFLSASNVKTTKVTTKKPPNLSQAIQDGTYYVSCLMTMARYNEVKSKKVLFNEEQVSLEEEIN